jgi:hypothetical protein
MTTDIRKNPITGQTIFQIDRGEDVDMVNNPPHYTSDPSGIECIEVTRHRNFNIGNAIKYLWRAGIKDDSRQIEDLKKAIFYINDEINRLEKINGKKKDS